jgi:xylulokinase
LLDAAGDVVRPAILVRSTPGRCRWLERTIGARRLLDLTSNPALTSYADQTAVGGRNELTPVSYHVLLPKDDAVSLSGEHAIDMADASGRRCSTFRGAAGQRRFALGRSIPACCPVFESHGSARVSRGAATAIGVPGRTPIGGRRRSAAGAVGMGITRPGAVSATIGTSGVVFAATDGAVTDPATPAYVLSRRPGSLA